jgi:hypothetical protein
VRRRQTGDAAAVDVQFDEARTAADFDFDFRLRSQPRAAQLHFRGLREVPVAEDLPHRFVDLDHPQRHRFLSERLPDGRRRHS